MDKEELRKLMAQMVAYMSRHNLQRIRLKNEDLEIELERPRPYETNSIHLPTPAAYATTAVPAPVSTTSQKTSDEVSEGAGYTVKAPLVGTFYCSNAPGAASFVKVGDSVTENSVVCIIEAMKVMNEVRAGKAGRIEEIYIENGHPVEFGTKIMKIV